MSMDTKRAIGYIVLSVLVKVFSHNLVYKTNVCTLDLFYFFVSFHFVSYV